MAIHGQGRFVQRFGQGRVREDHHAQVLGAGTEFHADGTLLDQLGGARADHVNAQYAVGSGVGNNLDHAAGIIGSHGPATGGEREGTDVDGNALALQLLLGLADPGDFRMGIDDRWDQVVVHLGLVPGDALGNHHTFFRGLVRQHGAANHVTNGVNARYAAGALVVDIDEAALVQIDTAIGGQQIGGHRTTADRHDQFVEGQLLLAFGIGEVDGDLLLLHFGAGYPRPQANLQTLLGQGLQGFLGDLLVGSREKLVQRLDHGDVGAQAGPHRTQFQTDHTGTDHTQGLGHALEFQGAGGVDDHILVDRSRRNVHWLGTGSNNHVLGLNHLSGAVQRGDFHLLAGQQLAVAFQQGHAVGLEQRADTAGEVFDDVALARNHRRHVDADALGLDTMDGKAGFGFVILPGAVQQSLGRNATDVQAGTAEGDLALFVLVLLDAGGLQTELSSLDGGHIAARAGTDDYHVEFLGHNVFL